MGTFDYSSLPPSDAVVLRNIAERLRYLIPRATSLIIEIGNHLKAAKARLGHGEFGKYCLDEVGIELRTAENYLALSDLAKVYPPSDVGRMPARTAYKVAAKAVPADVVETIMGEVREGRVPSFDDVQCRIARSKQVSTSHLGVDDLADRLIDVLAARDIGDLERFLRRGTKHAIAAFCDRLRHVLDQQSVVGVAVDMLPKNSL